MIQITKFIFKKAVMTSQSEVKHRVVFMEHSVGVADG